jgi:plasmid stability protein
MSELVVGNLEDDVRAKLQELAKSHGRSVEEEVRDILRGAVEKPPADHPNEGLGTRLARRFAGLGLDFEIPELRGGEIKPPSFDP